MEHSVSTLFLHGCILLAFMFATSEGSSPLITKTKKEFAWPQVRPQDTWWDRFMEKFRHTKLSVDWEETPQGHIIMLDTPGMDRKQIKVEVLVEEGGILLRVEGKKGGKVGQRPHYSERSHGKFLRILKLPNNLDLKSLKANLDNGVLTISIDKQLVDGIKAHKVNINVKDEL